MDFGRPEDVEKFSQEFLKSQITNPKPQTNSNE
jgi:hypothetical protein